MSKESYLDSSCKMQVLNEDSDEILEDKPALESIVTENKSKENVLDLDVSQVEDKVNLQIEKLMDDSSEKDAVQKNLVIEEKHSDVEIEETNKYDIPDKANEKQETNAVPDFILSEHSLTVQNENSSTDEVLLQKDVKGIDSKNSPNIDSAKDNDGLPNPNLLNEQIASSDSAIKCTPENIDKEKVGNLEPVITELPDSVGKDLDLTKSVLSLSSQISQESSSVSPMSLSDSSEFSQTTDSKSDSLSKDKANGKLRTTQSSKSPDKFHSKESENSPRKKFYKRKLSPRQQYSDSGSSTEIEDMDSLENKDLRTLEVENFEKPKETEFLEKQSSLRTDKQLDLQLHCEKSQEKHVTFKSPCIVDTPEDTRISDSSTPSFTDSKLSFKTPEEIKREEQEDAILSDSSDNTVSNVNLRFRPSYNPRDIRKFDRYVKNPNDYSAPGSSKTSSLGSLSENCAEKFKASFRKISLAMDKFKSDLFNKNILDKTRVETLETLQEEEYENKPDEKRRSEEIKDPKIRIESTDKDSLKEIVKESTVTAELTIEHSPESSDSLEEISKHLEKLETTKKPPLSVQRSSSGSFGDISEQDSDSLQQKKHKKSFCKRKSLYSESEVPPKKLSLQREHCVDEDVEMKTTDESETDSKKLALSREVSFQLRETEKFKQQTEEILDAELTEIVETICDEPMDIEIPEENDNKKSKMQAFQEDIYKKTEQKEIEAGEWRKFSDKLLDQTDASGEDTSDASSGPLCCDSRETTSKNAAVCDENISSDINNTVSDQESKTEGSGEKKLDPKGKSKDRLLQFCIDANIHSETSGEETTEVSSNPDDYDSSETQEIESNKDDESAETNSSQTKRVEVHSAEKTDKSG